MLTPVTLRAEEAEPDPWEPIRPLLGRWEGATVGKESLSKVVHEYEFVLNGRFIRSTTQAKFESIEEGVEPEIHEDIGYFSFDSERGSIILRQFLSEGYVNTYVLEHASADSLVLVTEHTEGAGGYGARLRLLFSGPEEYVEKLDLLPPGKDYFTCQNIRMKKVVD
jgi:hypothetical protein